MRYTSKIVKAAWKLARKVNHGRRKGCKAFFGWAMAKMSKQCTLVKNTPTGNHWMAICAAADLLEMKKFYMNFCGPNERLLAIEANLTDALEYANQKYLPEGQTGELF